jgi:hypothetical protein
VNELFGLMFLNLVDVPKKMDIFQCCCCVDTGGIFTVNDIESINLRWTLGRLCIEACSVLQQCHTQATWTVGYILFDLVIARMIPCLSRCWIMLPKKNKMSMKSKGLLLQLLHLVMILVKNRWVIQPWHGTPTYS